MEHKQLFGGAITCDMPQRFLDISEVREIPDNQEGFCDVHTDQSIIIELLSRSNVNDQDSAKFHFDSLAEDNQAVGSQITHTEVLTDDDIPHLRGNYVVLCIGKQQVSKFHETSTNTVNITMCLIRLLQQQTDIVINFNEPIAISPQSSSHNATPSSDPNDNLTMFKQMIKSFRIVDYSLFG
eukprot:TRINITY_DN1931_c0_g1_i1.p1 TRINITY_DN1931_c0_g1~~TRINITY_DN1931_c0_g1_i1.p1  ORF type:complete len:182 (+),score=41.01 TRINITY_DN1931_c0_g1_i1:43-588(+)